MRELNPEEKYLSLENQLNDLKTALNISDACIFTKDTEGRYTFVNQKTCELFEKTSEEIIGKKDHSFFDLELSNDINEIDEQVLKGNRIERNETNVIKKTGEVQIYKTIKVPLYDENGKIIGLCGISNNITNDIKLQEEQNKNKELIERQSANLVSLIENTNNYIWSVDSNYHLLTANTAFLDLIESLTNKRFSIGENLLDEKVHSNEQLKFIKEQSDRALKGEKFQRIIKSFNNELIELHFNPIYKDNKVIGFTVFGIDITKFKEVEKKLIENQFKYSHTQKIGKMGSWELDILNNKLTWSDEIYHIFKVPEVKELSFENFLKWIHPEDREKMNTKWVNAIKKIEPFKFEHRIFADGKIKWLKEEAEISFNDEGMAIYAIGFVQDITEQKLMEEKAAQSEIKYKNIVNHSPNIHFQTDNNFKLTFISPAIKKVTGYKPTELIGKPIIEIFKPTLQTNKIINYKHYLDHLKTKKELNNYGITILHKKNKTLVWLSTSFHYFYDELGNVIGLEGVAQDITHDKLAEAAVEKSESRLETIFREAPQGIALINSKTGQFYDVNPNYSKIVGRSLEELKNTNWMDITHPDDLQLDLDHMAKLKSGEINKFQIEKRLIKPNGKYIWIKLTVAAIQWTEGPLLHLAVIEDISQIKKNELKEKREEIKNKKQTEAFLNLYNEIGNFDYPDNWKKLTEITASTINVSRASIWELSDDNKELHCLNLYNRVQNVHEKVPALKTSELTNYFNTLLTKFLIVSNDAQNEAHTKELSEFYLKPLGITSLIDIGIVVNGKLKGVLCCEHIGKLRKWTLNENLFLSRIASIASQYFFNAELNKSEQTFKKLFYESSNPTLISDLNGVITDCNEVALNQLKLKRHELLNKTTEEISLEFQNKEVYFEKDLDHYFKLALEKGNQHFKWHIVLNSNEQLIADTTIIPLQIFGEKRIHISWNDITLTEIYKSELEYKVEERTKELIEALKKEKELNELKTRFVSMASHEFRTPLTSISIATGTLKEFGDKINKKDREKRLNKIENQVQHMTNLLEDFLSVGKGNAGKIKCYAEYLKFNEFISSIIEEIYTTTGKTHKISLTNDLLNDTILLDRQLGRNIFNNLLTNAIKFSPNSHEVLLKATSNDKHSIIEVIDFGIGIDAIDLKHIFEPFERSKNSELIQGTGLGLTIVKDAIELHKGTIVCESTLGKGTKFTITIPNKPASKEDLTNAFN